MKYNVGDRIKIYKIITNGGYIGNSFITNTLRPAIKFGINPKLLANDGELLSMYVPDECIHVATMVITKLK